jgi:hypothetical protein
MLFVDASTRFVVANQPDPKGELSELDGLWVGELPERVGIANTATTWAGLEWTMLMWPLPEEAWLRKKLLVHELYHRIQDERGLPGRDASNPHLDQFEGRLWLRCEAAALARALRGDGEGRRSAAFDALTLRAARHARFPGAAESERALELNEGLAEFTGWRLCGLDEPSRVERIAQALLERLGPGELFARGFPYATGPAYGALLDVLAPGWPKGLARDSDLSRVLGTALAWTLPSKLETAAEEAAARHDGARLRAEEEQRENRRRARLAEFERRFVTGPVLRLAVGPSVSFTFDPNGVEAFDEEHSVYDPIEVVDSWGELRVARGGALVRRSTGGALLELVVPAPDAPEATPVAGDGWTLRLAAAWHLGPGPRAGDYVLERSPR